MLNLNSGCETCYIEWRYGALWPVEAHQPTLSRHHCKIHVAVHDAHRTCGSEDGDVDVHTWHCCGLTAKLSGARADV